MKRKLRIFWLCMLILSMAVGAQAAGVTWDVGSLGVTAAYSIPLGGNGGNFWYVNTPPFYSNTQLGTPQSSSNLSIPATETTTETFGPNPGEIEFYAMGGGGIHADGVVNQAVAQITQTGMDGHHYINAGSQHITSNVQRSFSADPGAQVVVSAEITGIIEWINVNWNSMTGQPIDASEPYAGYQISGIVSLLPGSLSGGGVSADIPDPILLDGDNLSGSISFIADADSDIFYRLVAGFTIDTDVQNLSLQMGPLGPLPDVGSIGAQGDPLLMTTTVSQSPVPIPGTIILLLSGVAGLVTIRRHKK